MTIFDRIRSFTVTLAVLCTSTLSVAAASSEFDQKEYYLLTVDVALALHTRGGHTMLRVVDKAEKTDLVYNWGVFDFRAPGFVAKFLQGILIYRLDVARTPAIIKFYKDVEKRSIWQDHITLTQEQKSRLQQNLLWWELPEHTNYAYNIWNNNCSTVPRDLIDAALGGAIKSRLTLDNSNLTFRDYVKINMAPWTLLDAGIDLLLNSNVDRKINRWEELYLPQTLRQTLQTLPAFDNTGAAMKMPLLGDENQIVKGNPPPSANPDGYMVLTTIFLMAFLGAWLTRGMLRRMCLGGAMIFWGTISSLLGSVMVAAWLGSEHAELKHNANLWFLWPTDTVFILLGLRLIFTGKLVGAAKYSGRLLLAYALIHLGMTLVFIPLSFLVFEQNSTAAILTLLPWQGLLCFILIKPPVWTAEPHRFVAENQASSIDRSANVKLPRMKNRPF